MVCSDSVRELARERIRAGTSAVRVASELGVRRSTVYRWINEMKAGGEDVRFFGDPERIKAVAISRLVNGSPPELVCKQLGLSMTMLQRWREESDITETCSVPVVEGSVQPRKKSAEKFPVRPKPGESGKDVAIRELQTALAEKQMLVDFFAGALQRVEGRRRRNTEPGETTSTPKLEK